METKKPVAIKRLRKTGLVISTKMDKTVVVEVGYKKAHPKYEKIIKKRSRFYAHDKKNACKVGDRVLIEETRPLSKLKRWRVVEILHDSARN